MNTASIIMKMSDDNFRVQAFNEYCQRAQERYQNLVDAVTASADYIPDLDTDRELTYDELTQCVGNIMRDFSLYDVCVPLQQGYTTVRELLMHAVTAQNRAICGLSYQSQEEGSASYTLYTPQSLRLSNPTGATHSSLQISIAELSDQMMSNLHSLICLNAATSAFYERLTGNVPDIISMFNDKISDVFANSHVDVSSSMAYMKAQILNETDPTIFLKNIMKKIGVEDESEATDASTYIPANSDMSVYTGASPSCAIDYSSATTVLSGTVKVAAVAVVGIVRGVANLVTGLFKKVINKVREVVVDPYDLQTIGNSKSNLIDGFHMQLDVPYSTTSIDVSGMTDSEFQAAVAELEKYKGSWFAMKTKFCEHMFKWESVYHSTNPNSLSLSKVIHLCKPRVMNYQVLKQSSLYGTNTTLPDRWYGYDHIERFLDSLTTYGDAAYDIGGLSEIEAFKGMLYAYYLDHVFAFWGYNQLVGNDFDQIMQQFGNLNTPYRMSLRYWGAYDGNGNAISSVSNYDWAKLASGFYGNSGAQGNFFPCPQFAVIQSQYDPTRLIQGWDPANTGEYPWYGLDNNLLFDAAVSGLAWEATSYASGVFIPFSNNHANFNEPSFRIKSDDYNITVFNQWLNIAIVVVVVALVATASVIAIKKIARARYFKFAQRQGALDNKMWNGGVLTAQERRRYVRAKRRCDASSLFSSGLTSSSLSSAAESLKSINDTSSANASNVLQESNDQIVQLIKGSE